MGSAKRAGSIFGHGLVFAVLLGNAAVISAQNVKVYVSPVRGGSAEDKAYFSANIRAELIGAAFAVVETREESDFYMNLVVSRDPEARNRFMVNLTLFDTAANREIITLGKDYGTLDDMNDWNLYLIYQAMANAPIAKSIAGREGAARAAAPGVAESAAATTAAVPPWWDKWLWVGTDVNLFYQYPDDGPGLMGQVTVEVDFFRYAGFSTGFGYRAVFPLIIDNARRQYYHGIINYFYVPLMLKLLFGGANYVVMPCAGVELSLGPLGILSNQTMSFGKISLLGGVDFRIPVWRGALELGGRLIYDINRKSIGFGFVTGCQFGFFRKKPRI
jgi:hypothetical protein